MQSISLKIEKELLQEIDSKLKKHRYATRTEFIRDANREKLSELEKKELLKVIDELHKSSPRRTTDKELHEAGERAFKRLEEKFKLSP